MRGSARLALTVLLSRAAAAQWIAVLPPSVEPEAAPEIVDRLHEAASLGFIEGDKQAVPNTRVRELLAAKPELAACREGPCVRGISEALEVRRLVRPHVSMIGKNYDLRIELLGGGSGRVLVKREATCDICTMLEAEATLAATAAKVAAAAPPWPPLRRVVKVTETERKRDAALAAARGKRVWGFVPSWSAHRYRWMAFGASFLGAAASVAGAHYVARHGDCTDRDPDGRCVDHRNTGALGAALVGAGVVAFGGAAIATWLGTRPEKRVFVTASADGGMAGARFEY